MKVLLAAPVAALLVLPSTATGYADPSTVSPPYIDHTLWAQWHGLASLWVFPTPSGRTASRQAGTATAETAQAPANEAWAEVLELSPTADTPGMRAQFICHWEFAEMAQPGKTSWDLEPWRPVVDDTTMAASRCNPGGPEEGSG